MARKKVPTVDVVVTLKEVEAPGSKGPVTLVTNDGLRFQIPRNKYRKTKMVSGAQVSLKLTLDENAKIGTDDTPKAKEAQVVVVTTSTKKVTTREGKRGK